MLQLKKRLEAIDADFDRNQRVLNDPMGHVLRYSEAADQEIAAFIAAVFSYGNVKQIQKTLDKIFLIIGPTPFQMIQKTKGHDWKRKIPSNFKHRFTTAEDLGCLLTWLGEVLRRAPTLEDFFVFSQKGKPIENIGEALENFITQMTSLPCAPYLPPKSKGVHFLLPRPSGKSACKRLLLFLRWVVGKGTADLGLWKHVPPKILLIPVDTHVLRISRHLGLTKRKDNTWKTAQDITEKLKLMDPDDPTRFDFALCHLGISQQCPSRFNKKICPNCLMNDLCKTYARVISSRKSANCSGS